MINIIDDSLLEEVKRNNGITPGIIGRMCLYGQAAQLMGVDSDLKSMFVRRRKRGSCETNGNLSAA